MRNGRKESRESLKPSLTSSRIQPRTGSLVALSYQATNSHTLPQLFSQPHTQPQPPTAFPFSTLVNTLEDGAVAAARSASRQLAAARRIVCSLW